MSSAYTDDLRLAHVLADDADSLTMDRFKSLDLHVVNKPDLTPVSDADTAIEEALRRTLSRARPRDASKARRRHQRLGPRRWIIDPIDGTKNYVRGVPVWATLIGLMVEDQVVVGVVSAPALGRRWWASMGGGAWTGKSLMSAPRVPGLRCLDPRRGVAVVLVARRLGRARQVRRLHRLDAALLAHPGVRRRGSNAAR